MKLYAMEAGFLSRLRSDRRELWAYARSLGNSDAMRVARADLMASTRIYATPKAGSDAPLYMVDADGVAHIPIVGELTTEAKTDACGAYTAEALTEYGYISAAVKAADTDPAVSALALEVNSGGGYVAGLDAVAQDIAAVSKPVTAYVYDVSASAAYYLTAQADHIVALSPMSQVGSIGIAMEIGDDPEHFLTSTDAPDKHPDPATSEGQAKLVAQLDAIHAVFVRRVAEGRHVSADKVNADFGHGGVLTAEAAMAAGMVDEVRGSHLSRNPPGVAGPAAAQAVIEPSKEVPMEDQLKAEYDKGVQAGITQEKERVATWNAYRGLSAEGDKLIDASINDGTILGGVAQAKLTAAIARAGQLTGDNAPTIVTGTPVGPAGAVAAVSGLSAQDVADLKAAGLTDDEIKANAPKGRE